MKASNFREIFATKWKNIHRKPQNRTSLVFFKTLVRGSLRFRRCQVKTEADLRVPLFKTANGQKSISFRGPKLWNQLSSDVRLAPSLSTFKRRFKDVVEG